MFASFVYKFGFLKQGEAKNALEVLRKPAVPIDLQVQIKICMLVAIQFHPSSSIRLSLHPYCMI